MAEIHDNLDLAQFKALLDPVGVCTIEDGLFIADLKFHDKDMSLFNYPTKFNGYLGVFCVSGNLKLAVDLRTFNVRRNTFTVLTPGNIIRLENNEPGITCHIIIIALSIEYMTKLRFDLARLFAGSFSPIAHPSITFTRSEIALAMRYYSLMKFVIASKRPFMKESILALCSSLIYEVAGSWKGRMKDTENNGSERTRATDIYDRFIRLVARYHLRERGVQFYADKLFISTKYLARVVKIASGHTATYWIDSYVILEAQNLLRYSDLNIKEIVFKLNFSNQSVFHKYFKAHTGMTPSEYRNQ